MEKKRAATTLGPSRDASLIYVVDDNAALAEYATTVLEMAGYEVRGFSDPKEVLRAMRESARKPELLVTDFDMGDINGVQLIQSSHEIHPSLKTVLVSGTIDDGIVSRHPDDIHRFLGKPYKPPQLAGLVAELLGG